MAVTGRRSSDDGFVKLLAWWYICIGLAFIALAARAFVLLTIGGIDENTGQMLMSRQEYPPASIRWNHAFVDAQRIDQNMAIAAKLHEVEATECCGVLILPATFKTGLLAFNQIRILRKLIVIERITQPFRIGP